MVYNLLPGLAELAYFELDDYTPGALLMVSNLLWPWSIIWGMPAAIENTEPANIKLTIKAHMDELPEELRTRIFRKPPPPPRRGGPALKPGEEPEYIPPGQRPRLAVFDFDDKTPRAQTDYGEIIAEFFHSSVFHTKRFRVVEREQIKKVLQEQNFGSSDMADQSKAIVIGKILNVELILIGSVAKLGNEYKINARIVNVQTGETAAAAPTCSANREEDIDSVVTQMAQYLAKQYK
jgi:TolB-like protein